MAEKFVLKYQQRFCFSQIWDFHLDASLSGIGFFIQFDHRREPWDRRRAGSVVVPAPTARVRLQVPGAVSHGDCRPRPGCVWGTQHHRVQSRRQGPRLFGGQWPAHHRREVRGRARQCRQTVHRGFRCGWCLNSSHVLNKTARGLFVIPQPTGLKIIPPINISFGRIRIVVQSNSDKRNTDKKHLDIRNVSLPNETRFSQEIT